MKSSLIGNIKKSQEEYFETISQYKSLFKQEEIQIKEIAFMLDEIKCFWLERLEVIEFELEELTEKYSCFLLSGAIYLNVADYEHYYFKSLGDYHFISDPFLKPGLSFMVSEKNLDSKETIDYFKRIYIDTIEVLTTYKNHFFILPIREIAIKDEADHLKTLDTFVLKFISSSLKKDFKNSEEFCNNYESFEEIEKDMEENIRERFIFSDLNKRGLSLREKMELYIKEQMNFSSLIKDKSESQIFLVSTYSWVSQIIDILLICVRLGMNPYIRFEITFHYLALVMYTFIDHKYLREMIEKAIVFYILHKTIEVERFKKIEFNDFCKLIENKALLDVIISNMKSQKINIFKGGIKQVESIIIKEFNGII